MTTNVADKIALGVVCCCGCVLTTWLVLAAAGPWVDTKEIPFFRSGFTDTAVFGVAALPQLCRYRFARATAYARTVHAFVIGETSPFHSKPQLAGVKT